MGAAVLERNRSLSALNLLSCRVGDAGMERLGKALTRNRTLRQLKISGNAFTAEGTACFADMMGDRHGLQVLYLDDEWEQQLLPGIERNYSLLEVPGCPAAQPYLSRNARGYAKV